MDGGAKLILVYVDGCDLPMELVCNVFPDMRSSSARRLSHAAILRNGSLGLPGGDSEELLLMYGGGGLRACA